MKHSRKVTNVRPPPEKLIVGEQKTKLKPKALVSFKSADWYTNAARSVGLSLGDGATPRNWPACEIGRANRTIPERAEVNSGGRLCGARCRCQGLSERRVSPHVRRISPCLNVPEQCASECHSYRRTFSLPDASSMKRC